MRASPKILFALLVALVFTLATALAPKAQQRSERRGADSFLKLMMGDGRRLFAKHFFTKADVYFHSGYYPTIFDKVEPSDQKPSPHDHNKSADHHDADGKHDEHHDDDGHEEGMDFVKEPRDWIERFGRNFTIHEHTHLAEGKQREMLPWLKIAAEMDAQMIETYTTAAYWLRKQKNQLGDAREFLLEGLRNNPNNEEILFELGCLYNDDMADADRARNVFNFALNAWFSRPPQSKTNVAAVDLLNKIAMKFGKLESDSGNVTQAIRLYELGKSASPNPDAVQVLIDELRKKIPSPSSGNP